MDLYLPQQLQTYINAESKREAIYRAMAQMAPTDDASHIFMELAANEQEYVEMFKEMYRTMVGQDYEPPMPELNIDSPYQIILRQMIGSERNAFKEYHHQYMNNHNTAMKHNCHKVGVNKSDHIHKLIGLMVD